MAKKSGGSQSVSWKEYLPEKKAGDEARREKLEERRASWDDLIVPADGAFLPHVATRLAIPQVWLVGGVWLLKALPGLELFVLLVWLMPAIGLGFIFWRQVGVSRSWIYPNLFLIGIGLALGLPGALAVVGV